jgi:hypothetical protein
MVPHARDAGQTSGVSFPPSDQLALAIKQAVAPFPRVLQRSYLGEVRMNCIDPRATTATTSSTRLRADAARRQTV